MRKQILQEFAIRPQESTMFFAPFRLLQSVILLFQWHWYESMRWLGFCSQIIGVTWLSNLHPKHKYSVCRHPLQLSFLQFQARLSYSGSLSRSEYCRVARGKLFWGVLEPAWDKFYFWLWGVCRGRLKHRLYDYSSWSVFDSLWRVSWIPVYYFD
jgi:hypothetical protein